jgi:PST family polysaccharide transporter
VNPDKALIAISSTTGTSTNASPVGHTVAARVARGASAAFVRTLVIYVATAVSMLVLTRRLEPQEFGVYAVLVSVSVIAYNFVTAGFAYTFTRSESVDEDAVEAAFWSFETLYLAVAVALVAISLLVAGTEAHVLLRGMAAFLVLAPFRFPAAVKCWREVQLGRLAVIEASEGVTFQLVAVALVLVGLREPAFAYALAAAAAVSASLSMLLGRWRPRRPVYAPLRSWWPRARSYFVASTLTLWRDFGHTPVIALALGAVAAGYFGWAAGIAIALTALVTTFTQAAFVGFARVRDPELTTDALSRALRLLSLGLGGILAVLVGAANPIAAVVFAPKWLPAVGCMRFLVVAVGTGSLLTVFFNLALADGRVRQANSWLIAVFAATVTLALAAGLVWGVTGYALTYCVIMTAMLVVAWRQTTRRYPLPGATLRYVLEALACAITAAAVGAAIAGELGNTIVSLFASAAASLALYGVLFTAIARGAPLTEVRQLLQTMRPG